MPVLQRETDDFDMEKLQKSLKKQQQRSDRMRHIVTKLSPAEIRSLNNNAIEMQKSVTPSHVQPRSANSATPPLTPENLKLKQPSASGQSGANLPTPPGSPEESSILRKNSNPTNGMHIHSPVPLSHHKAGFVSSNNGSRSPSVSSHRSTPTYRGNEITRNRSSSMLRPTELTHQIVDNPLSQFSRPRQSLSNGSVSPSRQESGHHASIDYHPQHRHSMPVMNGSITPPQSVKSSVSAIDDEAFETTTASAPAKPEIIRAQSVSVDEPLTAKSTSRFSWSWRRSLLPQQSEAKNADEVKIHRRKSSIWRRDSQQGIKSIAYEDTKVGNAPEIKRSLKGDLPSDLKPVVPKKQDAVLSRTETFSAHPAVRPLDFQDTAALQAPITDKTSDKGKQREEVVHDFHDVFNDDSVPMYSRCSCCGKFKKQPGSRALSPVFENENLRANLSFEIGKTDDMQTRRRGSNSGNRQKYVPIIPMVMAEGNAVQAKIAPRTLETTNSLPESQPGTVNENDDIIAQKSEPIPIVPRKADEKERKIVRFSSLNLKEKKQASSEPGSSRAMPEATSDVSSNHQAVDNNDKAQHVLSQDVPSLSSDNDKSKHQQENPTRAVSNESIQEPVAGDLMAAMSGIDSPFELTLPQIQQPKAESTVVSAIEDNTVSPSSNTGLLSRGPAKVSSAHEQVTTASPETRPGGVEFQAEQASTDLPLAVPLVATAASRPKSILKQTPRSSYNNSPRTSVDYTYNPPTTYVPPESNSSTNGSYVTRPKATARYMHVAPMEVRVGPTTRTSTTTTTTTTVTTTKKVPPMTKPRPNVQAAVMDDSASSTGSLGRRTISSDELSARRLSSQSSRSYTSLRSNKWFQPRKPSNLVSSVSTGTKPDKMSKFERAVSKVEMRPR